MNSLLEPKSKKLKKSLNHRQSNHNILKKLETFDGGFWKDEEVTLEASTINHLRQLKRDQADVSIPKQESTKTHVSVFGGKMKDCCWAVAFMQCGLSLSGTGHTDPNWSILSNKYNPGQPMQKPGFWLSSRPFCIRTTFIWVHQGP